MANNKFDKVKITGYSRKLIFSSGIEYRNFSPDLVGLQVTTPSNDDVPLFTLGNFNITTNFSPKKTKIFKTKKFSNFVSLTDMDLTLEKAKTLLTDNAGVFLNLDKRDLYNYALFGSFREFVRVSLENIIINWPAALYVTPEYQLPPLFETVSGFTIQNYLYDNINNVSSFNVNTNNITNNFLINYLKSSVYQNSFSEQNKLRNLTVNYKLYSILYENKEYEIIDFVAANKLLNDSLYIKVKGNPFPNTTNGFQTFHIKPNKTEENLFFNNLELFEAYLLNRQSNPIYTAEFNVTIKTDNGGLLFRNETLTWPTRDGYNIDFQSDDYEEYSIKLLELSDNYDLTTSNLMVRFLVAESITSFDTSAIVVDPQNADNTDQKMNKTLTIFGRSFDDINKYINGVKFANTVSYNKENNTPDVYLKNIARVLGWDLLSSVLENNLLKTYIEPKESTYQGQAVGLTVAEADIELWRRIILNSPWLWKSKGSRKSIEFLFKFIGAPLGLITFNEYIYLAENKIDLELFYDILVKNKLDTDLSIYPINDNGYPKPLPDNAGLYFQSDGLWYRETGGDNSNVDINTGNNPHVGPYDGGGRYIDQFRKLIPNFTATTISSETITNEVVNIFTNYNSGTMNNYDGTTFVDVRNNNNSNIPNCYVVQSTIVSDPKKRKAETDCGCQIDNELNSLSVCINKPVTCNATNNTFKIVLNSTGTDGSIFSEDIGEDCTLVIDFDYLFKFDCESLTKLITTQGGIGTCSNVIDLLESLKATVILDVIDPFTGDIDEVFSEVIFPEIGQGNLYNYLKTNGDFTGFFVCGKLTNQNPNDNTCYPLNIYNLNTNGSQVNCSTFASNLISGLYSQASLNQNNTADRKIFESNVTENSFKSEWSKYSFELTNPDILALIKNDKIKLSVKIEGYCINSCVYFDNIKLEKKCKKIERKNIFISKTPGFDLDKIIDNKKSWVEIDEKTRRTFYVAKPNDTEKIRQTDYYLFDSEQVINTKEIDLDINIASAIETDVWDYIYDNSCLLTGKTTVNTGATFPLVVKDNNGNNFTLPISDSGTGGLTSAVLEGFQACAQKIFGDVFNTNNPNRKNLRICDIECRIEYECYDGFSVIKFISRGNEIWITCEKSGTTSQTRAYTLESDNAAATITNVTNHVNNPALEILNRLESAIALYNRIWGLYPPYLFKKDKNGNCIDCGCGECYDDSDSIDFDELFTLSIDTIDTLEDFKYFATSQLIDAKNRKTISAYPTLNLLYERYLNSNKYCTNLSSQFTYKTMDQFANLIGNYWVDLVEQVIPATTIWGATRVYSNTIFNSQKFQYKQSSLLFGKDVRQDNDVTLSYTSKVNGYACVTAVTTTLQGKLSQNSPIIGWEDNTTYTNVYIKQLNFGSEFIGSVGIIDPNGGSGGSGGPIVIVNDCIIGVTIIGENPTTSSSNGKATANVIGNVQQNNIQYSWSNGETTQTITGLTAGVYSVTVWDNNNEDCKAIDMITLIEV